MENLTIDFSSASTYQVTENFHIGDSNKYANTSGYTFGPGARYSF